MEPLNVAIVGCGDISGRHAAAYRQFEDRARVVACCDTDPERAARLAAHTGTPQARAVTDYAELLADPALHAVNLCLPHHLHASATIAAARAGKHVFCEKPLARSPAECDSMIAACREAGVVLLHGEPMRVGRNIEQAAEVIQAGMIGRLVGLQATMAYWQREELNRGWRGKHGEAGGGHLMDGGIHIVDALRHLGGPIAAISAMTASFRPELGEETEDLAVLNVRYREGHLGQLFTCHATRGCGATPMMTVFGSDGTLTLDAYGEGRGLMLFLPDRVPEVLDDKHSWNSGYERLVQNFLDAIQLGARPKATPEDGRDNVRLILAAYESAALGREVPVEV